jgi:mannosyl-oligosaccharide alpha-1,2-mannosidase
MFALQSINEENAERSAHYLELAEQIGRTCHESYTQMTTGIGSEVFGFSYLTSQIYAVDKSFLLRPEAIESWFYLWRITRKPIYREWAWEAAMAIEANCRTENGYSGIVDVNAGEGKVQKNIIKRAIK